MTYFRQIVQGNTYQGRLERVARRVARRVVWLTGAAPVLTTLVALCTPAAPVHATEEQICRFHNHVHVHHTGGEHSQSGGVHWAGHHAAPGDPEASASGRHYAPDRQVDVLHIDLDVTPDFEQHTVSGTATITFAPISQPLTELRLDAVHLQIDEVTATGAEVADHTSTEHDLTVLFTSAIPVGQEAKLVIRYRAEPKKGLYFRTPDMGYPETDTHVWSQGEPHEARHWYPCFDYPNERSSTAITCRVPPEMTVLSNGELESEEMDASTGLKAVRWHQEKPHVNYLICLVAGRLEKIEKMHGEIPLAFYTQPSTIEYAENSFADTAQIMAFYEKEIGVPFPWSKYYQVTIVDFMWGGMENTTLTTLTHNTLFDEATENLRTTRRLDAHELAHQWFGNYVTCKDWSHLWLNEGFATYYTHLYEGHKFGRDALLYGLYQDAQQRVLSNGNDQRPMVYKSYTEAKEQFDYRAYPKGSWVLHMLRSQLGEDLYRQCIKTYLERRALTSVVTEDLNDVIEELSGLSFDPFFDQWVYHARHPDLKVSYRWLPADKLAHVTVEQTHTTNDAVLFFQFPTVLRFWVDGSPVDHAVEIRDQRHEFYIPLTAEPTIVRFDPEYTVLANVTFNKPDAMLVAQLANTQDMIGRLYATEQLGKRKTQNAIDALTRALNEDPFYGVRLAAVSALAGIDEPAAYDALVQARRQSDARVRSEVVQAIARKYSPQTRRVLLEVVAEESNPAIVADAVRALAAYGGSNDVREVLLAKLRSDSFRNELADAAVDAVRASRDSTFVGPLMRVLADRQEKFTTRGLADALQTLAAISQDRRDKSRVREFLIDHVSNPRQSVRVAAIRALAELGDPLAAPILATLARGDASSAVTSAASDGLRRLDESTPAAPREVVELRGLLRELRDDQQALRKELETLQSKWDAQRKSPAAPQTPSAAEPATPAAAAAEE